MNIVNKSDEKWLRIAGIAFIVDMFGALLLWVTSPSPDSIAYKVAFWMLFGVALLGIVGLVVFAVRTISESKI